MIQILLVVLVLTTQLGCGAQQFAVPAESTEFGQAVTYNKEVDVLWVVDTSSSMASRQAALAQHIPEFINQLNSTGLDYHIGVTTMDMSGGGAQGKLIAQSGTPLILKQSTPNLVNILMGRIRAGEGGSPVERGREALLRALELSQGTGFNAGFLRENALLNVILLSDEEDQSDASLDYVARLDGIKPVLPLGDRSWISHFLGVMPMDPNCQTSEWGFSSPGVAYIALSDASGGSKESICDTNFRRALDNVRARILEVQTEYVLGVKPNIASIVVRIDGNLIPKNDTNGWSYRESSKSIRFHGTAIPRGQSRIQITYDPAELK